RIPHEAISRRPDVERHPRGPRTQSCCPGARGGDERSPGLLRVTFAPRTAGYGAGGIRFVKQTGRRRTRYQRDHCEGAPGPGDAENEGRLARGPGKNGREARPRPGPEVL